jgi:hypothetical protein
MGGCGKTSHIHKPAGLSIGCDGGFQTLGAQQGRKQHQTEKKPAPDPAAVAFVTLAKAATLLFRQPFF